MQNKVYTFSVIKSDSKNYSRVERLKMQCKERGQSFSWVVLKALELLDAEDAPNV